MISIIHPTRSRPEKSVETIDKWLDISSNVPLQLIVSLDEDDPTIEQYKQAYYSDSAFIVNKNRSCVDAVNNGAKKATGDILIVVSDDTDCFVDWDLALLKVSEGMGNDWILKTQDGIQNWIITAPIMDRAYYNRTGYIYHPDFEHMFCDTYMTAVADITGRKITSNLEFKHLNDTIKDDLRNKTNGTWAQGEATFIRLMKEFTSEQLRLIKDSSMRSWLKRHGVI